MDHRAMDVKAHTKAARDVGMVRVRVGLNYSQSHASMTWQDGHQST